MKDGVENHRRLSGIKFPSTRGRTKTLTSFESHRFRHSTQACQKKHKGKYSTVKCKHFLAVLVYLTKTFREPSEEKYNEFKGLNFYPMRARTKMPASFESQRIELAFIGILMAQ